MAAVVTTIRPVTEGLFVEHLGKKAEFRTLIRDGVGLVWSHQEQEVGPMGV